MKSHFFDIHVNKYALRHCGLACTLRSTVHLCFACTVPSTRARSARQARSTSSYVSNKYLCELCANFVFFVVKNTFRSGLKIQKLIQ